MSSIKIPIKTKNKKLLEEDLQSYKEFNKQSPDLYKFKKYEETFAFVYGTLMKKGRWDYILSESEYIGKFITVDDDFRMFSYSQQFPVVKKRRPGGKVRTTEAHIFGELYKINLDTLRAMDYLESNGTMYQRELVKVENPKCNLIFTAWMYVGVPEYWQEMYLLPKLIQPTLNAYVWS